MEEQKEKGSHTTAGKRRFWLTLLTLIFLFAGFIYLVYWLLFAQFQETTDDAYVAGNQVQVMPQVSGLVTAILADETDLVLKGKPIISLDKMDPEIRLENTKAQLALTVRQTKQLYYNVRQLQANLLVMQANLKKAQEDLQRRIILANKGVVAPETLQHYQADMAVASANVELAKQQLAAAIAQMNNIDLAHHPQVLLAAIAVKNAYLALIRTTIYAADTGYVARRNVQVGQQVTPSTVMMIIVPLNQVWVNANLKENQLRNIRIGQAVRLISDAYGDSVIYHGTVEGLSAGTGSAFDILPPQNATGNWIKIVQRVPVRIKLDPKELQKYPLRIGLSMDVIVNTHNREGLILSRKPQQQTLYETQNFNSELGPVNKIIDQIIKTNS